MIKKSLICGLLLLSIPFLAASCADLRDADRCYRNARLFCEKSCVNPDTEACIDAGKQACHDADSEHFDETWLDDCSDKLDELDDCAGELAVQVACADPSDVVGGACSSSTDCAEYLSCVSGICTNTCYDDAGCTSFITVAGGPAYCNRESGSDSSGGVCIGSCTSDAECNNGWSCRAASGGVETCGPDADVDPVPPAEGGRTGDPCDSSFDCNNGQCGLGYCSQSCSSQSTCSALTSDGSTMACAKVTGTTSFGCWPTCSSAVDCAPGSVCKPQTTPEGGTRSVCFESSAAPAPAEKSAFGESCDAAIDCSDAGARCETFCTKSCTTDSQCSTLTSSTGRATRCAPVVDVGNLCLPGCSPGVAGQCAAGSSCVAVQLPTGQANLCRPSAGPAPGPDVELGLLGDPCDFSTDCDEAVGLTCQYGMCTTTCGRADVCPDTSDTKESICAAYIESFPTLTGCTYTCDEEECLPGWECTFDPSVERDVCKHTL